MKRRDGTDVTTGLNDRTFVRQALSVFATKVLMLGSGLVASIVIARTLGPAGLGVFTAVFAVITLVITLADLGIRQATTYLMGGRHVDDDRIVANILTLWLLTSVVTILTAAAVFWFGPARAYGAVVLVPALASIPATIVVAYAKGVSLARGQIRRVNVADIVQRAAFLTALVLLLVALGHGVGGATTAYALGTAAAALLSFMWLRKVAPLRFRFDGYVVRRLLGLGIVYATVLFALNLNYRIDIIILERLVAPEDVGFYAIGVRFAELVWQVPAALGVVLFSRSATSRDDREAANRTIITLRTTLPVIVVACIVIAIAAPWILPAMFGPPFDASVASTRWLMPGVATAVVFKLLYADVAGRGRPALGLGIFVPMAAANVALNLVLIPRFGIEGAAMATSLTYAIGAAAFAARYARHTQVRVRDLFVPRPTDLRALLPSRGGQRGGDA